jgi:uncharacterized protein YndB with AHSA1/START domain
MIKKILIALAVIVVIFVVAAALQPADYRVTRSVSVSAPPGVVFAQVNDLHQWETWSPWEKLDPAMKRVHEGAPAGTGAIYAWTGNNKVGEGRMTITESRPNELVRFKLDFIKPFASTSTAEFTFKPEGDQTAVMWSMTGEKNFISKAVCLFMSMDKMVGGDFENGLANLKSLSEAAVKK